MNSQKMEEKKKKKNPPPLLLLSEVDPSLSFVAAAHRLLDAAAHRSDARGVAFWTALADPAVDDSSVERDTPAAAALRRPFLPRLEAALREWVDAGLPVRIGASPPSLSKDFAPADEDAATRPLALAADVVRRAGGGGGGGGDRYVEDLLAALHPHGIQMLLGMTPTRTTLPALPPPPSALVRAFGAPHGKTTLTVGARARAKHAARAAAGDGGFWGEIRGSAAAAHACAARTLCAVMRDAVWVNVFALPHNVDVLELRVASGHGMRFLADGSAFRGFLEPPMEGGHEVGWKH